ncbi:MAG: SDR family oxidoreductase [Nitrospirae bacterium]|nr:MAG: SDR family oxidoreductase [Nitrospirota bacterium]
MIPDSLTSMPEPAHQPLQPFAVITGASKGIGAEYARALAARQFDLLLVARDMPRLSQLATALRQTYKTTVDVEALDLAQPHAASTLFDKAQHRRKWVDLLINNAGFGFYGDFATCPISRIQEMLHLHINTVVESIRLFLPAMIERRRGAIINVASVAGFFPIPYLAEYAATKAFLLSFSQALAEEVRPFGIQVQACCPSQTRTDFHETAGFQPSSPLALHSPAQVVQTSLHALSTGRPVVTIGWRGKLFTLLARLLPHSVLMREAAKRTKPPRAVSGSIPLSASDQGKRW